MGTLVGHVAPGAGFLLIGLWHLANILKSYSQHERGGGWNFRSRPWFPAPLAPRRSELYLIISASLLSISSELFIFPRLHHPFSSLHSLSIPPQHLNNFEHSTISLFFLIYASSASLADSRLLRLPDGSIYALGALALAVELLLFHFHSSDHMGLEGHYHWLLQLIVAAGLAATLLEIHSRHSPLASLTRAASLAFQGLWFIQMGLVLWVPRFTPAGCAMHQEGYHPVVRCEDEDATHRAMALATLQFTWYLAALCVGVVAGMGVALRDPHMASSANYKALELHDNPGIEGDGGVESGGGGTSFKSEFSLDGLPEGIPLVNLPR